MPWLRRGSGRRGEAYTRYNINELHHGRAQTPASPVLMSEMKLSETSFGLPKLLRSPLTEKRLKEPETRRAVHQPIAHSRT